MSKIIIAPYIDKDWGNCVKMSNGIVELHVTVDFGPRVIYFARLGMKNMFYEDFERTPLGEKLDVYDDQLVLYGGHRLWIAPQILPRCYYPDNQPVAWEAEEASATFTAPVEKLNNIRKIIKITLIEDEPAVQLEHTIENCGAWDIEFAHWCVTQLSPGGIEIIPMPRRRTGLLPNRSIALWDYSGMNDARVHWGKDFITLKQNPQIASEFKLGLNNEDGWAAYFNMGQLFIKYFTPEPGGYYPDNGCSFETYVDGSMLESETLSELFHLEPGEQESYTEEWELYPEDGAPPEDEAEIKRSISRYLDLDD
jgi:hypothetical protein